MTIWPLLSSFVMSRLPQSGDPALSERASRAIATARPTAREIAASSPQAAALDEHELDAALQLLVERAQYITGATGTALALPKGEEMVCRASSGACAPVVGARLQVRSGLTGESIARRQLLRSDNAESDPRVNLEACRALGIASIVVMPLLGSNGEIRGLFELFSDHAYAFEERDLVALERMAALTITAMELAEQREHADPMAPLPTEEQPAETGLFSVAIAEAPMGPLERISTRAASDSAPESPPVPEAIRRVQKCASCGFPVSEGRTLCLDCENAERKSRSIENRASDARGGKKGGTTSVESKLDTAITAEEKSDQPSGSLPAEENLPPFLANSRRTKQSWLSDHLNLLALLVLAAGILIVFLVFFR